MKYRKKPVVIEAIEFLNNECSIKSILLFMGQKVELNCDRAHEAFSDYCNNIVKDGLVISTLEGNLRASLGDYIIKGVSGEFYPCKPDIFKKTYEKVGD